MAIDFPSSPTIGQTYTYNGRSWEWNGEGWEVYQGTFYPGAGIAVSTGTAWDTSKNVPTGDVVGTSDTQTLSNKTITSRVSSGASTTSPLAWNSDNYDEYIYTALANDLTLSADAGTPTNGRKIIFVFTDDGTPRTITFTGGASKAFQPVGVNVTASGSDFTYTTTASKKVYFGCIYDTNDARWDIVAIAQEA